jgi:hypothetical protein
MKQVASIALLATCRKKSHCSTTLISLPSCYTTCSHILPYYFSLTVKTILFTQMLISLSDTIWWQQVLWACYHRWEGSGGKHNSRQEEASSAVIPIVHETILPWLQYSDPWNRWETKGNAYTHCTLCTVISIYSFAGSYTSKPIPLITLIRNIHCY